MRLMRALGALILWTALVPLGLTAESVDLSWKLAVLRDVHGKLEATSFRRPLSLQDGDQFRIVLVPAATASVYVMYEDTTGQVSVLYQGVVRASEPVFLPSVDHSFEVTAPSGTEKIDVVVSRRPQTALEASFRRLPVASAAVLDELSRLKTTLLSIAEAPEKPVPMGGVTRGLEDLKMSEFHGSDTYVRTIRFDH